MRVYIKYRKRRKEEFQFFMHDFVDYCREADFRLLPDYMPSYRYHVRSLIRRVELEIYKIVKKCALLSPPKKAVIITANGGTITDNYFPYYVNYELIPMLCDLWPSTWLQMQRDFQLFNVKTVLVTARSVANMINAEMSGINALWIPEGIDTSHYHKGELLINRPYNVLEMGRQMKSYHRVLSEMYQDGELRGWTTSRINPDGTLNAASLSFPDNEMLYRELPKYKVMVCFPQCDTNPFRGGNVETLTQRYWEAMLSGCLMIGRAPQELIDFIGYNPVINVNWQNPKEQLKNILDNIFEYQEMVDKNYDCALQYSPWEKRIEVIRDYLAKNGYEV